jgi:hypothetical protein
MYRVMKKIQNEHQNQRKQPMNSDNRSRTIDADFKVVD